MKKGGVGSADFKYFFNFFSEFDLISTLQNNKSTDFLYEFSTLINNRHKLDNFLFQPNIFFSYVLKKAQTCGKCISLLALFYGEKNKNETWKTIFPS